MIQAIVRSSVPTSGAGISLSGPMSGRTSLAYRRVSRSEFGDAHLGRVDR